jgi:hypothetical protein
MKNILLVFCLAVLTNAQSNDSSLVLNAKTIKCQIKNGSAANWDNDKINIEKAKNNLDIIYDNINLSKQTARLIGNVGSSDVMAISTGVGLTLIEQTATGGLNILTIYHSKKLKDGSFPCVFSKHIELITPYPQQYYGFCKIIESN